MKIAVVFYSLYGHIFRMAHAVCEGINAVTGSDPLLRRVPETMDKNVLSKIGAEEAQQAMSSIVLCTVEELGTFDAIIFGTPTRFGNMAGQMRNFLDKTGSLWQKGALVGKIGSVFTSTAMQHGGQESTILSFHATLLHHGMIVVGLPYTFHGQTRTDEITGGSPYGACTITGPDGSRMPSENELAAARFQGNHVAGIAKKLFG